jgi:hypothetical protein
MEMTMSKQYHTLLERVDGVWAPQFGDYDRDSVVEEFACLSGSYTRKDNWQIIATGSKQADIDAKVLELNVRERYGPRPMGRGAQLLWERQCAAYRDAHSK